MNTKELLGMAVRRVWVDWAKTQPNPKSSWLVEWDDLPESDKEVDRMIGERLWKLGMNEAALVAEKHAKRYSQHSHEGAASKMAVQGVADGIETCIELLE